MRALPPLAAITAAARPSTRTTDDIGSDGSDDGSLASFDSDLLASMDFDELEARLAANEARERKALTPFSSASDLKQISTEAEAADSGGPNTLRWRRARWASNRT